MSGRHTTATIEGVPVVIIVAKLDWVACVSGRTSSSPGSLSIQDRPLEITFLHSAFRKRLSTEVLDFQKTLMARTRVHGAIVYTLHAGCSLSAALGVAIA